MTDQAIIAALKSPPSANDALRQLYDQHFPVVRGHILGNSGSADEAQDIFQEGVIALFNNVVDGKFKGESAVGTYLFSICKNMWLRHLQRKSRMSSGEVPESVEDKNPFSTLKHSEHRELVAQLVASLGEQCQEILRLYYFERRSMGEVADMTGFKDEQNARNKKYKCMKALKELIFANPDLVRELKD